MFEMFIMFRREMEIKLKGIGRGIFFNCWKECIVIFLKYVCFIMIIFLVMFLIIKVVCDKISKKSKIFCFSIKLNMF